jgi:hypothetical protein
MRVLNLNDDNDLVINEEILHEADYVVELEAGETIADFDRIQNLTNEEILDELDYEEGPYSVYDQTLEEQGYTDYEEMGVINSDNAIFVRYIDLTENLDEDQLNASAFYLTQPGGYAYEIVDREAD